MITCTFEHGSVAALRHVVVHAIVERDGSLLLVKRAEHLPEGGKWGLPGGFLDRDETLVEGVLDRQNVAFDFVVAPLEQRGEPNTESSRVEWIPIERLPPLNTLAFDHGDTIRAYLQCRGRLPAAPTLI